MTGTAIDVIAKYMLSIQSMASNERQQYGTNLVDVVYPTGDTLAQQRNKRLKYLADSEGEFAEICNNTQITGDTGASALMAEIKLQRCENKDMMKDASCYELRAATYDVIQEHCIPLAKTALLTLEQVAFDEYKPDRVHSATTHIDVSKFFGKGAKLVIEQINDKFIFRVMYPDRTEVERNNNQDVIEHKDLKIDGIVISNEAKKDNGETIAAANFALFTLSGITTEGRKKYTHANPKYISDPTKQPADNAKIDYVVAIIFAHKLLQTLKTVISQI